MGDERALLRDLLITTKDGDWGKDVPDEGLVPYRVIRGADFPEVRVGDISTIPLRYLDATTVERRTLQPDDILIETAGGNRDRSTGRTLLITKRLLDSLDYLATCASFSRFLRVDPTKADPNYVFWYLQFLYEKGEMWEHQVQHTGVARFQYTKFAESVHIALPSLPEQRAIAAILGTLDDKIELNRRMNRTLEGMAQALFKQWFVDGAEAGWEEKPVGELATIVGGTTPSTKEPAFWEDGTYHWATPKDLSALQTPVLLDTERKITEAGLAQIGSGLLPAGTVLLSSRAPIGYLAIAEIPVAINQGFIAMLPTGRVSNLFLLLWAEYAHAEIVSRANGSTFLEISKSNFRPIPVIVPDEATSQKFDNIVQPLYRRIVENEKQSRTLAALRDALLPKLISGEVRVAAHDAEKFGEALL